MGRASRKNVQSADRDGLEPGGTRTHWTDTHPDREMWSPARLAIARTQTQEEYEVLYGRSEAKDPPPLSSPLFPEISRQDQQRLQTGFFTGSEAREFIASMRFPQIGKFMTEELEKDPVLDAFWKSELRRLAKESESFQAAGVRHWFEDFRQNTDGLRSEWFYSVARTWFYDPETSSYDGWDSSEEGHRRMIGLPHSPLAAALSLDGDDVLQEERLAKNIWDISQKDPEAAKQYFQESLLPEIDFLTRRSANAIYDFQGPPGNILLRELWNLAASSEGGGDVLNLEANTQRFSNFLPPKEREVFLGTPLLRDLSKTEGDGWRRDLTGIYQEAWARKGPWGADNLQSMKEVADQFVQEHIVRVYSGLAGPDVALDRDRARRLRKEQEKAAEDSGGFLRKIMNEPARGSIPLDNLRPLFELEGKTELFDELNVLARRRLAEGHSFDLEKVLLEGSPTLSARLLWRKGVSPADEVFAKLENYLFGVGSVPGGSYF